MSHWYVLSLIFGTPIFCRRDGSRSKEDPGNQRMPTPGSIKAVRQFLGLVSYHRCYIKNFANNAGPLHQLT